MTEAVLHLMQEFLVPHRHWIYLQAVLFAAAFWRPTRATLGSAIAARIAMYVVKMPFVFDSALWANQTVPEIDASNLPHVNC